MKGFITDFRLSNYIKYGIEPAHLYVRVFSGLVIETRKDNQYLQTVNYQGRLPELIWRLIKLNVKGKNNRINFRWS